MQRTGKAKARIIQVEDGHTARRIDALAIEEPLEIQLQLGAAARAAAPDPATGAQTLAITMRTPGHDYELAAGFLYNEGIIGHKSHINHMIYCVDSRADGGEDWREDSREERQEYNVLRVHLNLPALPQLDQLTRHFFTTSACGVCGRAMLDSLDTRDLPPLSSGPQVPAQRLAELPARLHTAQQLFAATGGLHAAALFNAAGELQAVREDVGRHNALDKLIGWALLHDRLPLDEQIILVSGRASYELLQKCRAAGAPIFCAVSAPSSLAVELANRFGITLVAFLRGNRFNIYAGAHRIDTRQTQPVSPS